MTLGFHRLLSRLLGHETRVAELEGKLGVLNAKLEAQTERTAEREARVREREATVMARESALAEKDAVIALLRTDRVGANLNDRLSCALGSIQRDLMPNQFLDAVENVADALPGWCTKRKARRLADLALAPECLTVAEIGVYAGRSLIPMALALRGKPGAKAYAIESWDNTVATAEPTSEENDNWWAQVDLKEKKQIFLEALVCADLLEVVRILELPSNSAACSFATTLDLVHIDGSHAENQALIDTQAWAKHVRAGGIIVLDDISWDSVRNARSFLRERCEVIEEFNEGNAISYGIYRQRKGTLSTFPLSGCVTQMAG